MVSAKIAVISALCLVGTAFAAPAPIPATEIDYVNILIPGPGLPTPQELGLTNEDLTRPIPHDFPSNGISARDNVLMKRHECRPSHTCNIGDSVACFNYLLSLDQTPCGVGKIQNQMCNVNGCRWIGQAENAETAQSYCRDVAWGGKAVNDNCVRGNQVGGFNYAGGNGHLKVTIAGVWV
ncbi:hypothetical protein TWF696_008865 [Orbilia brochopaga]|uniref:Uncharacterized protein n=1 Tax=Orbilia brochopaga TaxID=3140254 RepID=A0AAV9UE34_9PEZI